MKPSRIYKMPRLSERECVIPLEPGAALNDSREVEALQHQQHEEAKAGEELRRIEAQAYAAGLEAGRREAVDLAEREGDVFRGMAQTLTGEFEQLVARMETWAVNAVLAMVKKIMGVAGETDLNLIRHSIRKVISVIDTPGQQLILHLHPDDYARLAPSKDVSPKNLTLVADEAIQRGGALLETARGLVDARLETQLEELAEALRQQVEAEGLVGEPARAVERAQDVRTEGRVVNLVGTVIESLGPNVTAGEQCDLLDAEQRCVNRAEVIGFRDNRVLLMPLGDPHGIGPGHRVVARGQAFSVAAGDHLLGRVLDGLGHPIDGLGALPAGESVPLHGRPNNPMERRTIDQPLYTGVRAIDGLLTCGKGGRLGVFAGSGVGKSVLLGMMGRNTSADINVIALIGERGREVREFVERDLGPEGLRRSVVVAVTSDQSPVLRIHGAKLAATIAEAFARRGRDVLFMMDSVTRFAMAHREIGLAAGEPAATKGYTPSTFAALPKLLERSGIFGSQGSITGFYTVLVEGDDLEEPVADHVRSILDGHIVLSRSLSSQNHFPAIDVLQSISRLSKQVCSEEQQAAGGVLRDLLAVYQEAQDLINIGAYQRGSNSRIDCALELIPRIRKFLRQDIQEPVPPEAVWAELSAIATAARTLQEKRS